MEKVRINYAGWNPYTIIKISENQSTLEGVAADIYEAMKHSMNFEYEATLQPDLKFGIKLPNGKWSGMVGSAMNDETDIIGPLFLTEDRAKVLRYSNTTVSNSQNAVITGLGSSIESPFLLFEFFGYQIWILLAATVFVSSCLASLIYCIKSTSFEKTKQEVFFTYVWMFYGALIGRDYGNINMWYLRNVWQCLSFRVLQGAYSIFISLILMSVYKGLIMSTLATEKLEPRYKSLEDVEKNQNIPISTIISSYTVFCFQNSLKYKSIYKRMESNLIPPTTDISTVPEFLNTIEKGKLVFIQETMFMKSLIGERFRQTGKCQLRVIPFSMCSAYFTFGFNKRFPTERKEKFDEKLRRFIEGGLIDRSLTTATSYYDVCTQEKVSSVRALSLNQMAGGFIIFCIGIVISIIVFVLEMLYK